MAEYSHKLKLSGWSVADRIDFISAGLAGYKRQCEKSDSAVAVARSHSAGPMNGREPRGRRKIWPSRPGTARLTLMFVPGTAASELKKAENIVTRKTAELGMTVRVVDTGGVKIKDKLVKLDLLLSLPTFKFHFCHVPKNFFYHKPQEEHCLTREKSERSYSCSNFLLMFFFQFQHITCVTKKNVEQQINVMQPN